MSILGAIAWQYSRPRGEIFDDAKNKCLYFIPAGYSQNTILSKANATTAFEVNRQELYTALAVASADNLNARKDILVSLCPEPSNPYDKNAIQVFVTCPSVFTIYSSEPILIGYIPKRICQALLPNLWRAEEIFVNKFIEGYKDKFVVAQIGVRYS